MNQYHRKKYTHFTYAIELNLYLIDIQTNEKETLYNGSQ